MPTRRENEQQLERILSSETVGESPKLVSLLRKLVEAELAGAPVDEYMLGREVFGKPENWIPMDEATVRQTFANLRKRLTDYYKTEGSRDSVLISFPKRQGYKPAFSYNPAAAPLTHCRRGAELFLSTFPDITRKATLSVIGEFEAAIKADPLYAPAHAALAEALLMYCLCDEPCYFSPGERIPQAEKAAKTAIKLDGDSWRAHITLAAIHCCRWKWREAAKSFDAAIRIAPEETRRSFWYVAYLIAFGKIEEAKVCAEALLKDSPTSKFKPLIKILILYVTREFDEAYQVLMQTGAEFDFVTDPAAYAVGDETLQCDNWPIEALMSCVCLSLGYSPAWRYAKAAVEHTKVGAFSGLLVLALGADARFGHADSGERALSLLAKMEKEAEHTGSLSMALAYIGVGKNDAAVACLEQACKDANPFMAWLHLWPVFDPLRKHRGFRSLVKRMKPPA